MSLTTPLRFKGAPGSPYTRKMLALLRYRRIPYALLIGDHTAGGLPQPKVSLLPTFYLENDAGELEAAVDSTPLIRRFEAEFDGRSVIPEDPVLGFINYLLEDYGDEWLTKAMFHYRWVYRADIDKAGFILPAWRNLNGAGDQLAQMAKRVSERQIGRLHVVGSNEATRPLIENSYRRFLTVMDELVERQTFLFGSQPASADFALYAQLTQLAKFDPTPAQICLEQAPRVLAWTDVVDDLSGLEPGEWIDRSQLKESLGDLLSEVGRVYVPTMLANARAAAAGDPEMTTEVEGNRWVQPTFPYQARCLSWVREEFGKLDSADRTAALAILEGTGCEALVSDVV